MGPARSCNRCSARFLRGTALCLAATLAGFLAFGCRTATPADTPEALLKTAVSGHGRARDDATDAILRLAERLAAHGETARAEVMYRTLWNASPSADRRHVRCAAIRGLAHVQGPAAVDVLVEAMRGDDVQVGAAATEAAAEVPGRDVTLAWANRLATAPEDVRPTVVCILGRRGGAGAEDAIRSAMTADAPAVRRAATEAAGNLGTPGFVGPLVRALGSADTAVRAAAEMALARLPHAGASRAIAAHLPVAEPAVRVRLVDVLLARAAREEADALAACLANGPVVERKAVLGALAILGDARHVPAILDVLRKTADDGVRGAAGRALVRIAQRVDACEVAEPAIAALAGAGDNATAALLAVLVEAPTAEALETVRRAVRSGNETVRGQAVRALAAWPGVAAAADLLALAVKAPESKHRILALRGYIRVAGEEQPAEKRVAMYRRAIGVAERASEKRLALARLAGVPSPLALGLALDVTGDETLRREAAAAVVGIAEGIAASHPGEAKAALEAVVDGLGGGKLRERAERLLHRLHARSTGG